MSEELPNGWIWAKMLDFLDYEGGSQPPKKEFIYEPRKGYVRLVQIRDFGDKPFPTYVPDNKRLKKVTRDDLLLARYGGSSGSDSLGRICTGLEGAYNVALAKLIFPRDLLETDYVRYLFLGPWFREKVSQNSRSCQTGFNREDVEGIEFPIAPSAEQRRIVTKLEKLLGQVDSCQLRLARIPALLKRFRQSVLAAACSGRLTADWREENPAVRPSGPIITDDKPADDLPVGWSWRLFGDYVENHDGKRIPISSNERKERKGAFPYYGASGIIDSIDGFTHEGEFVLIGEDGANLLSRSTPIAFLASGQIWVNNHAHVLKCKNGFPNAYLSTFINSIDLSPYVTGTAQPKLNQANMNTIPVAVPPLPEQREIVRRVEKLFALADRIEARFAEAQKRVDSITQSILAKAFRGELVPTEYELAKAEGRSFESAEELLERIKQSGDGQGRTTSGNKRTTRKRAASAQSTF